MSDTVLTTLISSGFILIGTIVTAVVSVKSGKTVKQASSTIESVESKIDAVEAKLDAHIKEDEWAHAKQVRIRILRFNDEICSGANYSENHFENIIEDIDFYEQFCADHPDYHNNKGKMAMEHINEVYKAKKINNGFL